jgi:hypothetical protein
MLARPAILTGRDEERERSLKHRNRSNHWPSTFGEHAYALPGDRDE